MGMGNVGGGMMMGGGSTGFLVLFTWLVWLAVGILLAVWLWKKISKE